jgi:hypothetical protein
MPPVLEPSDPDPDAQTRRALLDLFRANDALRVARQAWTRAGNPRTGVPVEDLRRAENRVAEARRHVERTGHARDKAWGGH